MGHQAHWFPLHRPRSAYLLLRWLRDPQTTPQWLVGHRPLPAGSSADHFRPGFHSCFHRPPRDPRVFEAGGLCGQDVAAARKACKTELTQLVGNGLALSTVWISQDDLGFGNRSAARTFDNSSESYRRRRSISCDSTSQQDQQNFQADFPSHNTASFCSSRVIRVQTLSSRTVHLSYLL